MSWQGALALAATLVRVVAPPLVGGLTAAGLVSSDLGRAVLALFGLS